VVSKLARIDAGTRSLLPRPEGDDSWTQQQSAEEIVAMILEQSSNSTPNTSRATIKLYQRMGNHSNVLGEADFSVADIRR
jgi:hypothetical protein